MGTILNSPTPRPMLLLTLQFCFFKSSYYYQPKNRPINWLQNIICYLISKTYQKLGINKLKKTVKDINERIAIISFFLKSFFISIKLNIFHRRLPMMDHFFRKFKFKLRNSFWGMTIMPMSLLHWRLKYWKAKKTI